jgi:hypothetical protein
MIVEEIYLSKPGTLPKRSFRWVYKVKSAWWVLQRRRIIDDSLVNPSAQAKGVSRLLRSVPMGCIDGAAAA